MRSTSVIIMASNICDRLRTGVTTTNAEETRGLATELARALPGDCVLALHGDLGVGKTTLVQGLAAGLGIQETVTSPTFNVFSVYEGERHRLVHLDAYRLEHEHQLETLMLEDFLISPWIAAVEWPDKIAGWIPADAWHLELSIKAGERHHVRLR